MGRRSYSTRRDRFLIVSGYDCNQTQLNAITAIAGYFQPTSHFATYIHNLAVHEDLEVLRCISLNTNTETSDGNFNIWRRRRKFSLSLAIQGIGEVDIKLLSSALNPQPPWANAEDNSVETLSYEAIL